MLLLIFRSAFSYGQGTIINSAVSGPWNKAYTYAQTTAVNPGFKDWGNGVIQLTDSTTGNQCQGTTLLVNSTPYNTNSVSNFSVCYNAFFGCPGNDQINADARSDGMSFSFIRNSSVPNMDFQDYWTCGGGLGYASIFGWSFDTAMVTIEFDTYSSNGVNNIDTHYGGLNIPAPTPGSINDEIALHLNGSSLDDANMLASLNVGNLEDGKVHLICITYNPTTYNLSVTIDGTTQLNYTSFTATNNLKTIFGANQNLVWLWGGGKNGSVNFQAVAPSNVSIFGQIGHGPPCNITLPVTLLDFSGELVNNAVLLNWTTSTENNNKEFIIERSYDGSTWSAIGNVKGTGNSTTLMSYNYTDNVNPSGASVYYRLLQVDINGASTYSKVITVKLNDNYAISIAPNPFEDGFTIQTNARGELQITICDVTGKSVYSSTKNTEEGVLTILPDLVSGVYIVTVKSDTFITQQKLVKK